MFKINPKKVLIKTPSIYDFQAHVPQERRKDIIRYVMSNHPNLQVKGGDSQTNPYKIPYELVLAEKREQFEKYKNSVLWSPRFTPWHFKLAFLYPAFLVSVLIWYIHNVAIPRRMVYLKKKYGYVFPELEAKHWLDEWWDYEEQNEAVDNMGYNFRENKFEKTKDKVQQKQFTDMTLQDLYNLEDKAVYIDEKQEGSIQNEPKVSPMERKDIENFKHKMQKRLEKIYKLQNSPN